MYYIFTDGASARNGQPNQVGGWGYIILDDKQLEDSAKNKTVALFL